MEVGWVQSGTFCAGGPPGPEWVLSALRFQVAFLFTDCSEACTAGGNGLLTYPRRHRTTASPGFPAIPPGGGLFASSSQLGSQPSVTPLEVQGLSSQVCIVWKASLHV